MNLFQYGEITLHSGEESNFKIECDALTDHDWLTIAEMIRPRIPSFGQVLGIPDGGLPLQRIMEGFQSGVETEPLLIVDDVYTTGASMRDAHFKMASRWKGLIFGVVVFARAPIQEPWVQALWTLTLERESPANLKLDLDRVFRQYADTHAAYRRLNREMKATIEAPEKPL
jgi:hypothetical protein